MLLLMGLAAGCAKSAPDEARLAAGSAAIVVVDSNYIDNKDADMFVAEANGHRPAIRENVPIGTRVQVEADDTPEAVSEYKAGSEFEPQDRRLVRLVVLDGPLKGRVGSIPRHHLRAVED